MTREEYNEFRKEQSDRIVEIDKETHECTAQYINEESLIKVGDTIVDRDINETWEIEFITVDDFGYFLYYVTSSYHFTESDLKRWGYKTRKC